jgi:hypothetical protein
MCVCLRLPIPQFGSGIIFFFPSFIPESHIWYLLISLFESLKRVSGLVFRNHMTKYHPLAFEDLFIPHMFHCLVNTMYGQTGQAAKVLHICKGSSRIFLHCSSFA